MSSIVKCPKCGQVDKIEKVSSIVKRQVQMVGTKVQGTALAATLMPPPKPELKVKATGAVIGPQRNSCLGETGFVINIILFAAMGIGLIALSRFVGSSGWLLLLGGVGLLAFTVWYYISSQRKLKTAEALHADDQSVWESQMQVWDELYYCYRDDVVFNPATGKAVPSSKIDTIYQ